MASVVNEGLLYIYSVSTHGLILKTKDLIANLNLGDSGSFPVPNVYGAGATVNLSGNLAGDQTLRNGPGYYQTRSYSTLWYEGALAFTATPFVLPAASSSALSITTPFTLSGNLKGFESNNINGNAPQVFDVTLTGKGQLTAKFSAATSGARSLQTLFFYFTPCHRMSFLDWFVCRLLRR